MTLSTYSVCRSQQRSNFARSRISFSFVLPPRFPPTVCAEWQFRSQQRSNFARFRISFSFVLPPRFPPTVCAEWQLRSQQRSNFARFRISFSFFLPPRFPPTVCAEWQFRSQQRSNCTFYLMLSRIGPRPPHFVQRARHQRGRPHHGLHWRF